MRYKQGLLSLFYLFSPDPRNVKMEVTGKFGHLSQFPPWTVDCHPIPPFMTNLNLKSTAQVKLNPWTGFGREGMWNSIIAKYSNKGGKHAIEIFLKFWPLRVNSRRKSGYILEIRKLNIICVFLEEAKTKHLTSSEDTQAAGYAWFEKVWAG